MKIRFHLEVVDEIASTNLALLERSSDENFHGSALLALYQSAGIGRRGRNWQAAKGNLALSFGLILPEANPLLPFIVGIALFDTLQSFLLDSGALSLKWPNDIYLNGAKLGGMLSQARSQGGLVKMVVGIGVNLRAAPSPDQVRVPAICLADTLNEGEIPAPEKFALQLLEQVEISLRDNVDFIDLKREWSARCGHLGKLISYSSLDSLESKRAIALEILPSGELLVEDSDSKERVALSSEELSLSLN